MIRDRNSVLEFHEIFLRYSFQFLVIVSSPKWCIECNSHSLLSQLYCCPKKLHLFLILLWFLQEKPCSIWYTKFAIQQLLIYPPHLHTAATLPWVKLICGFEINSKGVSLMELLRHDTPEFIPAGLQPQNCADLNAVDYQIWSLQNHL